MKSKESLTGVNDLETNILIEETMLELYDSITEEKREPLETKKKKNKKVNKEKQTEKITKEAFSDESLPVDGLSDETDHTEGEIFSEISDEDELSRKERRRIKKEAKMAEKIQDLSPDELIEKRRKKKKTIVLATSIILGLLLLIYGGFAYYFTNHFLFNTKINGTNFSLKNHDQAMTYMSNQVDNYGLVLNELDNQKETIKGSEIDLKFVESDQVDQVLKDQNQFLWFTSLWKKSEVETPIGVQYNEEKLQQRIDQLNCLNEEHQKAPQNATPVFKDTEFVIQKEVTGTQVDKEVLTKAIKTAIEGFNSEISLEKEGCYLKPAFVSTSPEVEKARQDMNAYLGATVTYDFNPNKEVVDASMIANWITVNDQMEVTFNEQGVKDYLVSLAEKYDTKGKPIEHTTVSGRVVSVPAGTFGWQMDIDAEYNALIANIQNAEVVEREPAYKTRGVNHDGSGVGSTYVEIDLTNQVLYYVQNGQTVMTCNIISGNPNEGDATPPGAFYLYNKQRNRTLRGPKQANGQYEWESPVSYWLPFNGAIGMHDATWQWEFGGNLYQTRGSHGCINMVLEEAGQLYDMITVGTPVLCYQ
ncbi:MAG TPA: L,D-transpeptidase/peptidoglycan binding protein [Candidatus Dorea intestinavium]|nr:L,D-transpeptidase/peptidoglycan binding protein [Candidatus Dorea intestinavium]